MKLSDLQAAFGGEVRGDSFFEQVSTDTRTLKSGTWFFALRGERHDGHHHLAQAVAAGASALIVETPLADCLVSQWVVKDTLLALQQTAMYWRNKCGHITRFALTGSSGKTTTKEMLAAMLSTQGLTLATQGNLNNHIGVPLTLLALRPEHRFAVIELGANHVGEIDQTAALVCPDCVTITNIGWAHLDGFGGRQGIAKGKSEIFHHSGAQGVAVINLDDEWSDYCRHQAQSLHQITVSMKNPDADVHVVSQLPDQHGCFAIDLLVRGQPLPRIQLPVMGEHNVINASLAIGMCLAVPDIDLVKASRALERIPGISGRMCRHECGSVTVIDDSYNANPDSMRKAIDVLAVQPGRKILVLGDMAELGSAAGEEHVHVGAWAAMKKIDALYAVGEYADFYAEGFGSRTRLYSDRRALVADLLGELEGVVSLLVKGSRSSKMDEVVTVLLKEQGTC